MPRSGANFNFSGVDGRGRQTLVRDPRNGGVAVVQIEDRENGSEGYTFDLTWDGGQGNGPYNQYPNGQYPNGQYPNGPNNQYPNQSYNRDWDNGEGRDRPGYRDSDYYRRYNHGFGPEEAVRVCQTEIERQASARFHRADIHFDRTRMDDGPGRQDFVVGMIDVHRGNRGERFRFSCSVDFGSGRVRTATLDPSPVGDRDR